MVFPHKASLKANPPPVCEFSDNYIRYHAAMNTDISNEQFFREVNIQNYIEWLVADI